MRRRPSTPSHGFTLMELMIVIWIVAIIASLTLPNLLQARCQSQEATTISVMRAIVAAQFVFFSAQVKLAGLPG